MKRIITTVFFAVALIVFGYGQPKDFFLSSRPYYSKIFDNNEQKTLKENFAVKKTENDYIKKSNEFEAKAESFSVMAKKLSKNKEKYLKKEMKFRKKAATKKIKGLEPYFEANKNIIDIYSKKLGSYKNSKYPEIEEKILGIRNLYNDSIKMAENKAATDNVIDKATYLSDKYYFQNNYILYTEYLFAVYNDDKEVLKGFGYTEAGNNEKQDDKNKQQNNNSEKQQQNTQQSNKIVKYDAKSDEYLFYTKNDDIDLALNYSDAEIKNLEKYFLLGKSGYTIRMQAKDLTDSIAKIDEKLKNTDDFMEKRKLMSAKSEVKKQKTAKMIEAIDKYYLANKTYFEIRGNHIYEKMPPDTTSQKFKAVQRYVKLSNLFYKDAQNYFTASIDKGGAEKYENLFKANEQMKTALGYQENAFDLMLNKDTSEVKVFYKPQVILANADTVKQNVASENGNNVGKQESNTQQGNRQQGNQQQSNRNKKVHKISGLYCYSVDNPEPKRTYMPSGTIYRVQVGTSKYLLPPNELKEYGKIYYETMTNTDVKRFLVGDYTNIDDAKATLNNLKSKGYKAYIVKYVNGKRQGAVYTKSYNNTPAVNQQGIRDITKTKYLLYVIQIGTFSTPKTQQELKGLKTLYYKKLPDGRFQYFVGPYYRYNTAVEKLPVIKQKGFQDAYIVAFNNGVQISLSKAKQIEQNVRVNSQVIYRVQVGAFSDYLTDEKFNKKFGRLKDIYPIHTHLYKGLIVYSVGNAKTMDEARKIRQTVVNLGYTDSFIIAFKGEKQVPLSSVNK